MSSTVSYLVEGMTCANCAAAVTAELRALDGVTRVSVDLNPAGVSTVTVVVSTSPLARDLVATAVDEAGDYRLLDEPATA